MTNEEGATLQSGDAVWIWHGYEWLPASVRGLRFGRMLHIDVEIETEKLHSGKFRKKAAGQVELRKPERHGSDKPRFAGKFRGSLTLIRRYRDARGLESIDS
jgi:hypothetical protein